MSGEARPHLGWARLTSPSHGEARADEPHLATARLRPTSLAMARRLRGSAMLRRGYLASGRRRPWPRPMTGQKEEKEEKKNKKRKRKTKEKKKLFLKIVPENKKQFFSIYCLCSKFVPKTKVLSNMFLSFFCFRNKRAENFVLGTKIKFTKQA